MSQALCPNDFDPVLKKLNSLIGQCAELHRGLDSRATGAEVEVALDAYQVLANEIRAAAKMPAVHEPRIGRAFTPCEETFFRPAMEAVAVLVPPGNIGREHANVVLRKVEEALIGHTLALRRRARGA